jgi:hypothetical protein
MNAAFTDWRSPLLIARIAELELLELATERALQFHAGDDDIGTVLHVRETLADAELWLIREELDYAQSFCERVERELIALRQAGRKLGAVP